jgi:hypothetical protein
MSFMPRGERAPGRTVIMQPHPRGWMVTKEGGERATAITETRKEALTVARRSAISERSELVIKDNDGNVTARSFPGKSRARSKAGGRSK